jgi:hypothetical protein
MNDKLATITNLFEGKEIRSIWNSDKEEYYFSVIDIISVLTESSDPSHYWRTLKSRMIKEGNETVTNCDTFKLKAKDGKMRNTDMLDTQNIFRLIESIPSPKAESFKMWLASLGKERIDEVFDPELAVNRAIEYYRKRGYDDKWIKSRLTGIVDRFKLTDVWKDSGITKDYEYGILTNEIYKSWSGMKASEYKAFKGLRKESLRDNMTDVEVALADLGELATREIAKKKRPKGLNDNIEVARRGGKIAGNARRDLEQEIGDSVVTSNNALNYEYIDELEIEMKN